jgi:hypothetical protein
MFGLLYYMVTVVHKIWQKIGWATFRVIFNTLIWSPWLVTCPVVFATGKYVHTYVASHTLE